MNDTEIWLLFPERIFLNSVILPPEERDTLSKPETAVMLRIEVFINDKNIQNKIYIDINP